MELSQKSRKEIFSYSTFNTMHEAVHSNISKIRWINNWVGRLSALSLIAPYKGFRYMHLAHHRHLNIPGKDPDLWCARKYLFLRWLTQNYYYYNYFLKTIRVQKTSDIIDSALQMLAQFILIYLLWIFDGGYTFLIAWFIPSKLAVLWLSYCFSYIPHIPHDCKTQTTRYTATVMRTSPWLTLPCVYQNYHLIHHLYPSIPFYNYGKVWRIGEDFYKSQGTRVIEKVFKL